MKHWRTVQLGDLVTVVGGGTPNRSNAEYYGGNIPWVTPKDMKSWDIRDSLIRLTKHGLDNSPARMVPENSVLIVVRSGVLKHTIPVGINRTPVALNQDMKALLCSGNIYPDFLARVIKARSGEILSWVRATTADNFPIEKLKRLNIKIPSPSEQKWLTAVLDRADALQAKRHEALAQLDDLIQSIFLDMFGDPATSDKSATLVTLGEVADIQGGLQVTESRKSYSREAPYLRVANVFRNQLNLNEIKILRVTDRELERARLQTGDLLVVEGHGNAKEIGRSAIWNSSISNCVHQNHLIRVRLDRRQILPEFACHYLNSSSGRRHLLKVAKTTSGLNTISTSNVRSAPIAVFPVSLQEEFVRRAEAVDRLKKMQRAHMAELDALLGSLQHRAFRGEL